MIKKLKENLLINIILLLLCPAVAIYLSNYILRGGLVVTLRYLLPRYRIILVSYIPLLLASAVITFVTGKVAAAYLIVGGVSLFGAAGHYYKVLYRSEALFPTDIVFAKNRTGMIGEFNISLTKQMYISLAVLALAVIVSAMFTFRFKKGKYSRNLIGAIISALLLVVYTKSCILNADFYKTMGYREVMTPIDSYYANTFHTAFLFYINNTMYDFPENYSEESVEALLSEYTQYTGKAGTPDIILIMDESYFYPDLNLGLEFDRDISENYREIASHGVYGNLLSSKYGGGTADIEFNVLAQVNTTLFSDSISYMNVYGNDNIASFVWKLKEAGYTTKAFHAYTSELYNRVNTYPNMGFDEIHFMDDYGYTDKLGEYISDSRNAKQIISEYEKFKAGDNDGSLFLYTVTMQNHVTMKSEISDGDYVKLSGEGYSEDFREGMSTLASYQMHTDRSLKELYDYFSRQEREVIIIVYGDHQIYAVDTCEGFSIDSLEETESYRNARADEKYIMSHKTQFVMWDNKQDLGGVYYDLISPSYLWSVACVEYNLVCDEYEEFMYCNISQLSAANKVRGIYRHITGQNVDIQQSEAYKKLYMMNYDILSGDRYSVK